MDEKWMIMYQMINGKYEPVMSGSNIVPDENMDKVIHVPEEVARQSNKFTFDGKKLKRKDGEYIMTLEEIREDEMQYTHNLHDSEKAEQKYERRKNDIKIEM